MNRHARRGALAQKRHAVRRHQRVATAQCNKFAKNVAWLKAKASQFPNTFATINGWRVLVTYDAVEIIGTEPPASCGGHKHWCVALCPDPPPRRATAQDWSDYGTIASAFGVPPATMVACMKRALETKEAAVHLLWVEPASPCEFISGLCTKCGLKPAQINDGEDAMGDAACCGCQTSKKKSDDDDEREPLTDNTGCDV